MKNQIKYKKLIYPRDIKGYVKISNKDKEKIIRLLINRCKRNRKKEVAKLLNTNDYWYCNFLKNKKIDSQIFKKIVDNLQEKINIIQFNDDKGGSSIPFKGKFPIKYTPAWHFLFCLSLGDGHIKKGKKKQFQWYQKPEGLKAITKLIKSLGFIYNPKITSCKRGINIPQLIRKIGDKVTGLKTQEEINKNIFNVSAELGKEYEIALLMAFFLDEAGMRKRNSSEITLHQEGNLKLLENFGSLFKKFNIEFTKNSKGNGWCIRLNNKGIIKLNNLFNSLNKYNLSLFHRQEIFDKKVKIARKNLYKPNLRTEAKNIKESILNKYKNKEITLKQIRKLYNSGINISTRSKKLVSTLKKQNKLEMLGFGKYKIRGE